jgi:hypothetical protein
MTTDEEKIRSIVERYKKMMKKRKRKITTIYPPAPVQRKTGRVAQSVEKWKRGEGKVAQAVRKAKQKPSIFPAPVIKPVPLIRPTPAVKPAEKIVKKVPSYKRIKKAAEEKPKTYIPQLGQPGWFEPGGQRHREVKLSSLVKGYISGFLKNLKLSRKKYTEVRIAQRIEEKEIIPIPGTDTYQVPETGEVYTEGEISREIRYDELPRMAELFKKDLIVYDPNRRRFIDLETEKPLKILDIKPLLNISRTKIKINSPPPGMTGDQYKKWNAMEIRKRERQISKVLPGKGETINFRGQPVPANPKQIHFSDGRLNKTYNIKVGVTIAQENYDRIMSSIHDIYDNRIGYVLDIILKTLGDKYQKRQYLMGATLNFQQHLEEGNDIGWYPKVRYIPISNYKYFKEKALDLMLDGFNTIRSNQYHFDWVEFVYIEVHFTSQEPR